MAPDTRTPSAEGCGHDMHERVGWRDGNAPDSGEWEPCDTRTPSAEGCGHPWHAEEGFVLTDDPRCPHGLRSEQHQHPRFHHTGAVWEPCDRLSEPALLHRCPRTPEPQQEETMPAPGYADPSVDLIGEHGTPMRRLPNDPGTAICLLCGAVVGDGNQHDAWHRSLARRAPSGQWVEPYPEQRVADLPSGRYEAVLSTFTDGTRSLYIRATPENVGKRGVWTDRSLRFAPDAPRHIDTPDTRTPSAEGCGHDMHERVGWRDGNAPDSGEWEPCPGQGSGAPSDERPA